MLDDCFIYIILLSLSTQRDVLYQKIKHTRSIVVSVRATKVYIGSGNRAPLALTVGIRWEGALVPTEQKAVWALQTIGTFRRGEQLLPTTGIRK